MIDIRSLRREPILLIASIGAGLAIVAVNLGQSFDRSPEFEAALEQALALDPELTLLALLAAWVLATYIVHTAVVGAIAIVFAVIDRVRQGANS